MECSAIAIFCCVGGAAYILSAASFLDAYSSLGLCAANAKHGDLQRELIQSGSCKSQQKQGEDVYSDSLFTLTFLRIFRTKRSEGTNGF
jgi:hypothetical protein